MTCLRAIFVSESWGVPLSNFRHAGPVGNKQGERGQRLEIQHLWLGTCSATLSALSERHRSALPSWDNPISVKGMKTDMPDGGC